jgi:hypothetical protein
VAKSMTTEAKQVAGRGAKRAKLAAADVLSSAAAAAVNAAAEVVLQRLAEGMGAGAKKVEETTPIVKKAIGTSIKGRTKKKAPTRKATLIKKPTTKVAKRKSKKKAAKRAKSRKKR